MNNILITAVIVTAIVSLMFTFFRRPSPINSENQVILKAITDRLDKAAKNTDLIADALKVSNETAHINAKVTEALATQDRARSEFLEILMQRIDMKVTDGVETAHRVEQGAVKVATDLSDSHARADAVSDGTPGAAADAAAITGGGKT